MAGLVAALAVAGCDGGGVIPQASHTGSTVAGVLSAEPTPQPQRPTPSASAAQTPHVLVIVMENREYSAVTGGSAPFLATLIGRYGLATRSFAASHPSLPNYLDLISGSTQGVTDDGTGYVFAGPTLVDQLARAGIGWRAYMEAMPLSCYRGGSFGGGYAKKHNPFMYFSSITDDPAQCARVVPAAVLTEDLRKGTVPPFAWLTPDLCDDGHDCSTQVADAWLHRTMDMVLASSWYADGGIVVITWDEGDSDAGCCHGAAGGHIATLVVSRATPPGSRVDIPVDHAGLLRTLETLYGVPYLGAAADPAGGSLLALMGR